jgi:hypothetical protein
MVSTNLESDRRWWLGDGSRSTPRIDDPAIQGWLGREAIAELAALSQIRIERFFQNLASEQNKPKARFFLEKFLLEPVVLDLLAELYSDSRELILVRDFRDVASSVLAFNRKRGFEAFGREHVDSDAEYIRTIVSGQALGVLQRWQERKDSSHVVRYEDLLTEPEATLVPLFEFVGIDASAAAVDHTLRAAMDNAPNMDHHRTAGADPAATIGRWKKDLAPDLVELCAESLDPALEAFGYAGTGAETSIASETH